MLRSLITTLLLVACATGALASPAHATTFGMGDQSSQLFQDKRFTVLTKVKTVRYIAPWDVENDRAAKATADLWIAAAKAKGYLIHVTFNYSLRKPEKLPSPAAYAKATKAFVTRHKDDVETWGVFNESNRGTVPGRFATPSPKMAALYFKAFRTQVCVGCKVVGLDLLDGQTVTATLKYLTAFNKAVGTVRPKIIGFHNYSDTNRASMARTGAFLKAVKSKSTQVWITETGGLYRLGNSFKPDSRRQATATKQVFAIAKKYPRLARVYFYNFYGPGEDRPDDIFDAGLISGLGAARPAYTVFKRVLK